MRFTLNGQQLEMTAADVQRKLRDLSPEPLHQYAVQVDSVLYPVKQAFEAATGVTRREFTTETARRHFVALDLEIVNTSRRQAAKTTSRDAHAGESASPVTESTRGAGDWHTEARVQTMVVEHLIREGWHIVRSADTATRERGIDVEATRESKRVAIEVKGFPSRGYADPRRAAERKRSQPSTQAKVWYSLAVLAAMITRTKMPEVRAVIALPDFPRYRALFRDTESELRKCEIELWWVAIDGTVTVADPDR